MVLAHISGIPIEETALSLGPVVAAGGGIVMLRLRERFARGRPRRNAQHSAKEILGKELGP